MIIFREKELEEEVQALKIDKESTREKLAVNIILFF